jgi:diguanylate cyclase (GGDEF)-like protein
MSESYYITPNDIQSGELMKTLVQPLCSSALCLFPGTHPKEEDYRKAVLIVTSENIEALLDNPDVAKSTPILQLVTDQSNIATLPPPGGNRLIDCLVVPVSREIFRHRLNFLCQVQKISVEHHANSVNLHKQLNALSTRDPLTGLFNRRQLTTHLAEMVTKAENDDTDLAILMFNIDFFNKVNKASGLHFGDFILNELAARLTIASQGEYTSYRYSGEDFVVVMPDVGLEAAGAIARKIITACSDKPYICGMNKQQITISAGIASRREHRPQNHDDFLTMAETALFMAKARGRNRIHTYSLETAREELSPRKSLAFLKETIGHVMEKTRISVIDSLQLLARNVAGPEHLAHISAVSHYLSLLGQQMGLPAQHIQTFQNAITLYSSFRSLLHNDLLAKPGKLSRKERMTIDDLPFKLTELTNLFDYFANERNVLLYQGEKYDGSGHPQGLKGEEIPLGARIFTIVDALAAMNADRPYRRRLTPEEIIDELTREAGKQFDPYLVAQLLTVIEKNRLFDLDPAILHRARQKVVAILSDLP